MPVKYCLRQRQQGLALVITLWLLVLLTIMAAGYSATMRTETRLTAQQLHASQARAASEAGVWLAVQDLLKPETNRNWTVDGNSSQVEFGDAIIDINIQDQSGMIDINTARSELLEGLLEGAEVEDALLNQIVDAIQDWRDRDDEARTNGAEDSDYSSAGYDYGAKDGPFNSIDELRKVMGMTEEIYQHMRPALTIYSHLPGINPDVAPKQVLMAIPNMTEDRVETFISSRSDPSMQTGNPTIPGTNSRFTNRSRGISFMVTSTASVNETRVVHEVVISLRRTRELPYTVLSWREI